LGLIFRAMDYFIGVLLILMGVFVNFKKGGQFVMTFAAYPQSFQNCVLGTIGHSLTIETLLGLRISGI